MIECVPGVPTAMPILAVFLCALPLLPQDDPALTPKLGECRLVVGAKELAALGGAAGILAETTQGAWHLRFSKGFVEIATSGAERAPVKVGLPSENFVEFPGAGSRAYLVDTEQGGNRVDVLDLEKGTWAAHWTLDDEWLGLERKVETEQQIVQILADDHALYVLREEHGSGNERYFLKSRVVARLEPELGKVTWARRMTCAGGIDLPGAILLAPMRSGPMAAAAKEMQLLDHDLLLGFGGSEPLVLLLAGTADPSWSIDRLWEYQRGYIGPSIWSHFLGRFGADPYAQPGLPGVSGEVEERRKAFETIYRGSVVAGPFPVRRPAGRTNRKGVFVITAVGPRQEFGEYRAQQFAYEIDEDGRPVSIVALPRTVLGWANVSIDDRVVVACGKGAWICLGATDNAGVIGSGFPGSGPDAVGRVCWYSEPSSLTHKAWMICDPAGDPIALDARLGVRSSGGGWIEKKGETTLHFPLWILDPRDGRTREVELRVPFEGSMGTPTENVMIETMGGIEQIHTWGARGLGLTRLQLDGDRLLVWLANSKQAWKLEFDARELQPAK